MPIHDRYEIQEAAPHWDVGNVGTPDLVWAVDHDIPEQIRPDLMLWALLAGIWFLIDWHQAHEPQ